VTTDRDEPVLDDTILRFRATHTYRGGFRLDVAFIAGPGVTAFTGSSGSGKSTIFRIVAGLLRPDEGRVVTGGTVLLDTGRRTFVEPHRRGLGVVFQESLLLPHRDVRANLLYGARRNPGREVSLDRVVEVLELRPLLDRAPATLSGGEARRVAIGRALLRGPRLLLLDEPWAGLDVPLRDRVVGFVARCIEEWGLPTILVSHEPEVVAGLADREVTLHDGSAAEG